MTDISVFTQAVQAEDRSWDLTPPEGAFDIGGTLSVAAFTAAQHYPNGYLPSGTVIGLITASQLWGPYLDTATDGRQTAKCLLRFSVQIVRPNASAPPTKIGAAGLVHGRVDPARLPFTSATAAAGGYLDANGQADLPLIYFGA